jgi:hypothetical protein
MEPASIRYKNPGAMWGNALAIKWGAQKKAVTLHDGKGQGNNIAVFPTFVQGICAQLDLWRTSKNYRNKRFCDAIAIWSGHNEVESYIRYVLARVPGMTRNTVMNDAFWRSPMGIAFLKAQAGHEAGKKYPAQDADWIEAQRCVFAGVLPAAAPEPTAQPTRAPPPPDPGHQRGVMIPADPAVTGDPELFSVQKRLKARNYSPGIIDGLWGSGTSGALSGFVNDRGGHIPVPASLDAFSAVREDVKAELGRAESEGWFRPVSEARKSGDAGTVATVAPEVVPVAQNRTLTVWGSICLTASGIYKAFSDTISGWWDFLFDHKDDIPTDPGTLQTAWGWVTGLPSEVWIFAGALGLAFIAIRLHGAVKKINEDVKTGARQ